MEHIGARRWRLPCERSGERGHFVRAQSMNEHDCRLEGVIMKYMLLIYDNADTRDLFFGPEGKSLGRRLTR